MNEPTYDADTAAGTAQTVRLSQIQIDEAIQPRTGGLDSASVHAERLALGPRVARRLRGPLLGCQRCGAEPVYRYAPITSWTPHVLLCVPCVDAYERSTGALLRRTSRRRERRKGGKAETRKSGQSIAISGSIVTMGYL
jgi:hypothetical protein